MQTGVWISLTIHFVAMLGIGFYAYRKSTGNSEEYMLGGRDLPPAVAALSAGASDMSGWLLRPAWRAHTPPASSRPGSASASSSARWSTGSSSPRAARTDRAL